MELFLKPELENKSAAVLSEMAEGFYRKQRGEINQEQYLILNAHGIAADLKPWHPAKYLPIHPEVDSYLDSRLRGVIEFDRSKSVRLGEWLHENYRNLHDNTANRETLVWAMEICRKNNLLVEADRIEFFLPIYDRLEFPEEKYTGGRKVQVKDSHMVQAKLSGR